MHKKQIDVILPFHREDQYLRDAISSLNQSEGVDLRILLIDTRNEHNQGKPINIRSSHTIEMINAKSERTYAEAINIGFLHLKNEIFALMNSDDLVHPKRFIYQINKMEKDQADFSICKFQKFSKNKKKISALGGSPSYSNWRYEYLFFGPYGADATMVGKSKTIKECKLKFSKYAQADWIFALSHYKKMKLSILPFVGYYYRMHAKQITRSPDYLEMNSNVIELIKQELAHSGIKVESSLVIQSIAMPYSKPRLSNSELKILSQFISKFIEIFSDTNEKEIKKLLARRIIFISFFNRKLFKVEKRLWRFILTELFRISFELITSRPRIKLPLK